jgi:hypothetical protein
MLKFLKNAEDVITTEGGGGGGKFCSRREGSFAPRREGSGGGRRTETQVQEKVDLVEEALLQEKEERKKFLSEGSSDRAQDVCL